MCMYINIGIRMIHLWFREICLWYISAMEWAKTHGDQHRWCVDAQPAENSSQSYWSIAILFMKEGSCDVSLDSMKMDGLLSLMISLMLIRKPQHGGHFRNALDVENAHGDSWWKTHWLSLHPTRTICCPGSSKWLICVDI